MIQFPNTDPGTEAPKPSDLHILKLRIRQLENELRLSKEENDNAFKKFIDLLIDLEETNQDLANKNKRIEEQRQQLAKQLWEIQLMKQKNEEMQAERTRNDEFVNSILPVKIAQEYRTRGRMEPVAFEDVTILFLDIVDFTKISERMPPKKILSELHDMYGAFDLISDKYGCDRIKTIGDAYLAIGGMAKGTGDAEERNHSIDALHCAVEINNYLLDRNRNHELQWRIRTGVHCGEVIGGIVGSNHCIFDVFGDAINTAQRMQSACEPMRINVSEQVYRRTLGTFDFHNRGLIQVKGKGDMQMYYLLQH